MSPLGRNFRPHLSPPTRCCGCSDGGNEPNVTDAGRCTNGCNTLGSMDKTRIYTVRASMINAHCCSTGVSLGWPPMAGELWRSDKP